MAKDSTSKVKATKHQLPRPVLGQSSRGKKAWRKNVDIQEVEQGLEEIRAEERVVGTAVQNLKDDQLFQIDVKGDDNVRHVLPKFDKSQLTSAKILAQRSARKANVSREDKERLLRIAKRPRKGPFNSVQDTSEFQSGEGTVGLSEAVKASGSYDAWVEEPEVVLPDGLETVHKKKVKAPVLAKPRDQIDVPAVLEPHQGTSYNPPVEAHQELLVKAAEIEAKKVAELEKMAETKKKMEAAKLREDGYDWTLPPGMQLDRISQVSSDDDEEGGEAVVPRAKQSKMKTQAQKNRAARVAAEQRALSDKAAKKKLLASIEQAKSFRKATARQMSEREKDHLKKRLELQEKMKKMGLAGQKLGKHKVPEGEVSVQIGEDLSESLRGLKPEGNLFRDRFQSLQQRALIEPRNLVLPKRRKHRIVEYEKHAWKRFDRD
ncbi:ribosome biogenesis protein Nop53/GLTSCR2 [Coprinopsis sp. MPI-PUGE-AT-0042]|nr:ribosome biogenesis protein Nop53/GLTSCR2 [Coprinopsis sp. MPI-PUGE-AT-0042]